MTVTRDLMMVTLRCGDGTLSEGIDMVLWGLHNFQSKLIFSVAILSLACGGLCWKVSWSWLLGGDGLVTYFWAVVVFLLANGMFLGGGILY